MTVIKNSIFHKWKQIFVVAYQISSHKDTKTCYMINLTSVNPLQKGSAIVDNIEEIIASPDQLKLVPLWTDITSQI